MPTNVKHVPSTIARPTRKLRRTHAKARHGAPPHLVKAVTQHRLALARDGAGWRALALLDV